MKRILALFLSAALLLALLCACTADNPENTVNSPDPTAGASAAVSPTDTSQEPSLTPSGGEPSEEVPAPGEPSGGPDEAPSESADATAAPTATAKPTATPAPTPSPTPKPTPTPTPTPTPETQASASPDPSPTLPGGGIVIPGLGGNTQEPTDEPSQPGGELDPTGPSASDVNLSSFYQTVLGSYAFPGMMYLSTDDLVGFYPGLASIPAVQRVVYTTAIGFNTAEIALIQVTSNSDVSAVKAILQARVDSQIAGGAFYPAAVEAWENNYHIVSNGNYIMLVVHSSGGDIVDDFNALF